LDIEEFYDENPARRASGEVEYGRDWSDANGGRCELSWVEATGELYLMAEPVEPIISDMFGDERLQSLPTSLVTVEVLGVVEGRSSVDQLLSGWSDAMRTPNSVSWVRDRLANGAPTEGPAHAASADLVVEMSGDDGSGTPDGASVIIGAAISALSEHLPASESSKLAGYEAQAAVAGSSPHAEWHRAYACARWAEQIVAKPAHHHLAAEAAKALEIVREVGVTVGAEARDLGYLSLGKGVSFRFQTELAWVYEAVHIAARVADDVGWDAVPWEQLLQGMLDIPAGDRPSS
jgi:hypothetical protein